MACQLIASPYPEGHVVVSPGRDGGVRIGAARYAQLRDVPAAAPVPAWLAGPAHAAWDLDVTGRTVGDTIMVRPETGYGYARASYELNLGCNYDCEHCYLGDKQFAGLDWPGRERLLDVMAEAGVLWLQLTGGEPLIDPLFPETHARAWDMGMMIQISSNGSRLDQPRTLEVLTRRRPYRLTLSIYGGTEESYDGMTRRRGSFRRFMRGLAAAHEAQLRMRINIVVSNRNAHEIPQMKAIADRYGIESFEYANISPTIHGGAEVLPSQSRQVLRKRTPYTGCNAGLTHFHADPHGRASICKVGRDPQVDLIAEGAVPEAAREEQVIIGHAVGRWPPVLQHGQLAGLHAHVPFVRAALLYNRSRQPRPPRPVAPLLLRAPGVADLHRAIVGESAVIVLVHLLATV